MILRRSAREKGTVLIMALLIVAVVAGLSIKFASDYQLGLSRAENRWHGQQAHAYMRGVEALAIILMKEDDPAVDYLGEGWDTESPFPIDGGMVLGAMSDASSRINLNELGRPFPENIPASNPERYSEAQRRFIRLLQCFPDMPITQDDAIGILEAIVDWTDADQAESGFGGAETFFYQSLEIPYRAANAPFISVDELRLVRYMTPELMTLLRPYITVLPVGETININTMPPRLWRTLNASDQLAPLDEMDAEQLLQSVPADGYYRDLTELTNSWGAIGNGTLVTEGLGIKTNYFWLRIQVSLVNQQRTMHSLLQRNGTEIRVIRRVNGDL